jgi:hypothetical protein
MLAILFSLALAAAAQTGPQEDDDEPALVNAAPVIYGGAAYQGAFDRAQRYEDDGRIRAWHAGVFSPALEPQMVEIYRDCTPDGKAPQPFTLIVSFAASGQVDGVFVDRRSTVSQCMAERFANLTGPLPPVADFAEEVRIVP